MEIVVGILALSAGLAIGVAVGIMRGGGARIALARAEARLDEVQATLLGVIHERDQARAERAAAMAAQAETET